MVSKSFSTSERRGTLVERHGARCTTCGGSLAEFAQSLYMLLIAHADDFGREEGDVFTVQVKVDPLSKRTTAEFTRALAALEEVGLVQWFTGDGMKPRRVLAIVDFDDHQSGLHKRSTSKFPEPPGSPGKFPGVPSQTNLTEQNRTKDKNAAAPLARPRTPKARPNVKQLAAVVLREVLPLRLTDPGDVVEAAKEHAAKLRLPYDGVSITKAIASATAQARRGVHP